MAGFLFARELARALARAGVAKRNIEPGAAPLEPEAAGLAEKVAQQP